ncbi:myomegalin-like isoform X2 [Scleropages formosus]|uniref:myomegalin-like isoform X2 n=1 Tax=Scleropages formosus TaxID=113540 RepID=UPI0010FABF59|nr:myomegalin-like isoform X2 [Scleropages formosus]
MMDSRMKDVCRVCGGELCGNQRRWIFHPSSRLSLQVLLSHAVGSEVARDGRSEFTCSKCSFTLERLYRFDTVIARVQALSVERLQKLLLDKEGLRQHVASLYSRNNNCGPRDGPVEGGVDCLVGVADPSSAKYGALLQEDLAYSEFESWAGHGEQELKYFHGASRVAEVPGHWPRRCQGCSGLRVADSDYEAVCRVPRKAARSLSCGPSTRSSAVTLYIRDEVPAETTVPEGRYIALGDDQIPGEGSAEHVSPTCSAESLNPSTDPAQASAKGRDQKKAQFSQRDQLTEQKRTTDRPSQVEETLSLGKHPAYMPIKSLRGSRLPVLVKPTCSASTFKSCSTSGGCEVPFRQQHFRADLSLLEDLWQDVYMEYIPLRLGEALIERQQSQLSQYERAAGECDGELQKAQHQVRSLQAKIQRSEASNQKLQDKLCEMETELHSVRHSARQQERTIQSLSDTLRTRDVEAEELRVVVEGQNESLRKLREAVAHRQLQQPQALNEECPRLQADLLALQGSLFSTQLELQGSRRAREKSERQVADLIRDRDRLQNDQQEALEHRSAMQQHSQELRRALREARSALREKEERLREQEGRALAEREAQNRTVQLLRLSLQEKEQLLQEYSELLDSLQDRRGSRDVLLDKLRERVKERDRALERSVDDKFRCLEEKDAEVQRMQLALREKDRDLERLRCVTSNNEDTITSLDSLLRAKQLELDRVADTCKSVQRLQREVRERLERSLAEKETLLSQMQASLNTRTKEVQELTAALLSKVSVSQGEVVEQLQKSLHLKELLFQKVLSDRNQQAQEHHAEIQELLRTIGARDQYIQDSSGQLAQVISERQAEVQELRRQLMVQEREEDKLRGSGEGRGQLEHLHAQLHEKEAIIQELMQNREEPMVTSSQGEVGTGLCDGRCEAQEKLQAVQEELHIALRKEKEAQLEVSSLRLALSEGSEETSTSESNPEITHHKEDLMKLVSLYRQLSEALKTERQVYNSVGLIRSQGDGPEKMKALHVELDKVQALRGQLEELLSRARGAALAHEKAAAGQPSVGELSTEEEPEEEDGSSEFTDGAEEADVTVTARTLAAAQNGSAAHEPGDFRGGPVNGMLSQHAMVDGLGLAEWRCKMQQLVEQKRTVERELGELKAQLERTGYASLSQMRMALLQLRQENDKLKVLARQATCRGFEKRAMGGPSEEGCRGGGRILEEESEEEREERESGLDDTSGAEREPSPMQGKRGASGVLLRQSRGKRPCTRPHSLDLGVLLSHGQAKPPTQGAVRYAGESGFWRHVETGLREQAGQLRTDLAMSRQESRELQERLMVSEATVQAQAEQLKEYRELLTETSVEQHSKQVQVDLQDLGYETCGRSENEAEREDASSPEFDDLEVCTALARQDCVAPWWAGDYGKCDDVADLRAQLAQAHRAIRRLQARVRSLSATSDYASSLERPQRGTDRASRGPCAPPAPGGPEEDEGWQSDAPGHSRELQELVIRVASLEAQLKSSGLRGKDIMEDTKSATWPGKFDTLIQAQARELSHLRQRMREGRGICHALQRHLGDTTKAFEELLRANDVDYYMGQSFRQQLAQSHALAERVGTKIGGRDRPELREDKTDPELLVLRLRKELQQKDEIIESLHTKLQRAETPLSCRDPSETTDHSDGTSFMSDERGSVNEDPELSSDVDLTSEYGQEEQSRRPQPKQTSTESLPQDHPTQSSAIPSPTSLSRDTQSYSNCPSMPSTPHISMDNQVQKGLHCGPMSSSLPNPHPQHGLEVTGQRADLPVEPHSPLPGAGLSSLTEVHQELQFLQKQLGESFPLAHSKPLSSTLLASESHPDPATYPPLSHHAFQPNQFACPVGSTALNTPASILESSVSWERGHGGYANASSVSGGLLMEQNLKEVRSLRQRLEESIRANECLRLQLEERLALATRNGGAPTNIYIQGLESLTPLTNENRSLKEENLHLQARLQACREIHKEVEQLREAVLSERAQLKEAELEAEQWKEEIRRLQGLCCEQAKEIQQLQNERHSSQERTNRLQHEVNLLEQQLSESQQLLRSLQCEVDVYDQLCRTSNRLPAGGLEPGRYGGEVSFLGNSSPKDLADLLVEVRGLRAQLERSVQENSSLRAQLEQQLRGLKVCNGTQSSAISVSTISVPHDLAPSPPVRDIGLLNIVPPCSPYRDLADPGLVAHDILESHPLLEGDAPDGSFASKNGRHAVGHVDDFSALQQQILEGKVLVQKIEATLQCSMDAVLTGVISSQALHNGYLKGLFSNTRTLRAILEESSSLLRMFWRAALPSSDNFAQNLKKEEAMKEEIQQLRRRIQDQEEVLQGTVERLRSTNRTKENMENYIVNQLSRTRDVLKKARTNLENKHKVSTLSPSSSSPGPGKAESPRSPLEGRRSDWALLNTSHQEGREAARQCPPKKRRGQRMFQVLAY